MAQTQAEMNKVTHEMYLEADQKLNEVYQKILTEYADDKSFISSLKVSQRNWIAFRDSEMKMKYPDRKIGYYGSIYSMCLSNYKAQLTRERTATLSQWISGIEDGDACGGSVRITSLDIGTILKESDPYVISLVHSLSLKETYRTEELLVKVYTIANYPGSAGFNNGEATHNILIAISEFDEFPNQALFKINNLYNPKLMEFDGSNPAEPVLSIQHIKNNEIELFSVSISINRIEKFGH